MEVIKKYTAEETEKLRKAIVDAHIFPVVREVFDKYSKIETAILTFAQYWSDEADDAVYPSIIFSLDRNPDFITHVKKLNESYFYERFGPDQSWKWQELVEGPEGFKVLGLTNDRLDYHAPHWAPWPGNKDAISAFSAYCHENIYGPGTYSYDEAVYGLIRRQSDKALSIEVVGEMIRPWLDGVMPEREQNES